MRILLLGATGRTGKWVLKFARAQGYGINVLSRNSNRLNKWQGVRVFEGSVVDKNQLEKAMIDCDALISVLNISRTSDFPWAKLRTPTTFLSDVMSLVVSIALERKLKRIVICSAWGVHNTKNEIPIWFKWLIDNSNIGVTYADHQRQENIITRSNMDWTIVRPVGLTNSMKQQKIKETFDNVPKPSLTISRKSLAKYLVDCLENDDLLKKKVVVSIE